MNLSVAIYAVAAAILIYKVVRWLRHGDAPDIGKDWL